jgi:hypothetical protein
MPHSHNPDNIARLKNEIRHWRAEYNSERRTNKMLTDLCEANKRTHARLAARVAELEAALAGKMHADVRHTLDKHKGEVSGYVKAE